jgi:hypothetical protein
MISCSIVHNRKSLLSGFEFSAQFFERTWFLKFVDDKRLQFVSAWGIAAKQSMRVILSYCCCCPDRCSVANDRFAGKSLQKQTGFIGVVYIVS